VVLELCLVDVVYHDVIVCVSVLVVLYGTVQVHV
jgi:hypothetical protein